MTSASSRNRNVATMTNPYPRITFGMIVLNGEPYLEYNLRTIYPFAHQIIVVEGATPAAAAISTPDGHSIDTTLHTLNTFKKNHDPEDKLVIITRDGYWDGEKDEMSQAYAERVTGDYLWQVDSDEFYKAADIERIIKMLRADPSITGMSFKQIQFWGDRNYFTDGWYLRRGAQYFHRLFRWGEGYTYTTHRPPTVTDPDGQNLLHGNWIHGREIAKQGIYMYHYSLVFPEQVRRKVSYYTAGVGKGVSSSPQWFEDAYLTLKTPFRVHNVYKYPSWLKYYRGKHPKEIDRLWHDIEVGRVNVEQRQTDDIERLLQSPTYRMKRSMLIFGDYLERYPLFYKFKMLLEQIRLKVKRIIRSII